ncbi:hypothetical protein HDU86_000713 [Geranomyces michiganensis]|nr:hypothetical protein HDU86_000713 [Geranomyces michiganensis]
MSLLDDIFSPARVPTRSADNPLFVEPVVADEDLTAPGEELQGLTTAGEPIRSQNSTLRRTHSHRRGSAAHSVISAHRRNHSVNSHRVGGSLHNHHPHHHPHHHHHHHQLPPLITSPDDRCGSIPPLEDEEEEEEDAGVPLPPRVHIPLAISPVRSLSGSVIEIPASATPASATPSILNPWKEEDDDERESIKKDRDESVPEIIVNMPVAAVPPPAESPATTGGILTTQHHAAGSGRSISFVPRSLLKTIDMWKKNMDLNELSVRSAPPMFANDRKDSICPSCDDGGNASDDLEAEGSAAYDRWKDARSEHTIVSGFVTTDALKRRDLVIKLTRALSTYGAPSHRLEHLLANVGDVLEVESTFFVLPALILISFGNEDHSSSTHLVKTPQGFNMDKLTAVNALCLDLASGTIMIDEALERLSQIRLAREYGNLVSLATFPLVSMGIAIAGFNANWLEAAVAAVLSLLVGGFGFLGASYPSMQFLMEFASALFVGLLVRCFKKVTGACMDETIVTLSALAILLPGLSLTLAILELSTRNLVSGTVRMFGALFTAMMIGFALSVGPLLWKDEINPLRDDSCMKEQIPPMWNFLFFPLMSACICIFFQAHPRLWPIMMSVSALGFVTSYFLNNVPALSAQGGQVSTALSALAIGLASNIYARVTNQVAVAPILSGILLLVPGSLGVRSTLDFLGATQGQSSGKGGTSFAFSMLLIGFCITLGLSVATRLVFPIRNPKINLTF